MAEDLSDLVSPNEIIPCVGVPGLDDLLNREPENVTMRDVMTVLNDLHYVLTNTVISLNQASLMIYETRKAAKDWTKIVERNIELIFERKLEDFKRRCEEVFESYNLPE